MLLSGGCGLLGMGVAAGVEAELGRGPAEFGPPQESAREVGT